MTKKKFIAGPHLTVAATPDRHVALVMHYDSIEVKHVVLSPDEARAHAADIVAAAARAERPLRIRTMTLGQPDRSGLEWAGEHDERL